MISDINFTTAPIRMFKNNVELGSASGFFFTRNERKYFITNRHVVIKESENFFPDTIKLRLHLNKTNLNYNLELTINLYNQLGNRNWLEHFDYSNIECDIIAIPLNENILDRTNFDIFYSCCITFIDSKLTNIPELNPFGDVVVVGYPLGFYDFTNNLPVYRKAMVASQYGVNFNGKPYFLIDTNLHPGTSGSPVVNTHHTLFKENGFNEAYKLFGIHSAEHTMKGKPLGLNVVWYSYLINEVIDGKNK
jgi:hypothetical protein